MAKKYVENSGNSPLWVSGILIAPGEGREVWVADEAPTVAQELPSAAELADAALTAELEVLRGKSVAAITPELAGLTQEALDQLSAMEQADPIPRKTLLEALGNEMIRRADAALTSDNLDAGAPAEAAPV
jgi:hypothetical protein